jgi:Domain of unknown function (DUF4432)
MHESTYRGRRAVLLENDLVRVSSMIEGGHVAEILHKASGVNPLWQPPWPTIEPSKYDPRKHPEYGNDSESKLLSGILGHNICLDVFGPPSPEEYAAGIGAHGEGPVAKYKVSEVAGNSSAVLLTATLPASQLRFEREIELLPGNTMISFSETVENLSATDRPIAWTQHVTLGPPFLERGGTQFSVSATQSKVADEPFNDDKGMQATGAEFTWPFCPMKDGTQDDLRVFSSKDSSGGFTAHVVDPSACFIAWSPTSKVAFGYVWRRDEFPWLSRWEENHLRASPPWNSQVLACGMEFGVSPMAETRRKMIDRGALLEVPGYKWIPARTRVSVQYAAFIAPAETMPKAVIWASKERFELHN